MRFVTERKAARLCAHRRICTYIQPCVNWTAWMWQES